MHLFLSLSVLLLHICFLKCELQGAFEIAKSIIQQPRSVYGLATRWHHDTTVKQPKPSRCYSTLKVSFSLRAHSLLFERSSFARRRQSDVAFVLPSHIIYCNGMWSWSQSQLEWFSSLRTFKKFTIVTWRWMWREERGHTRVYDVFSPDNKSPLRAPQWHGKHFSQS